MAAKNVTFSVSLVFVLLFLLLVHAEPSKAGTPTVVDVGQDEAYLAPLAPADTSSPRATMKSFLSNMYQAYEYVMLARRSEERSDRVFFHSDEVKEFISLAKIHFRKAIQCLDLSAIPKVYLTDTSYESALLLKEILDRIELPSNGRIPGKEYGIGEQAGFPWILPGTEIEIGMVTEGTDRGKYLFTSETVKHLENFYRRIKGLPYKAGATEGFYSFYARNPGTLYPPRWAELLPEWARTEIWEQGLWQWLGAIGGLILSVFFFKGVMRTCERKRSVSSRACRLLLEFAPPLTAVVLSLVASYVLDQVINVTGVVLMAGLGLFNIVRWLGLGWATFLLGDLLSEIMICFPGGEQPGVNASLVRTVNRLISLSLALAVLVRGADTMGISLIPVITGFGVVGLALSLAAKPTVENVIGGITLFADRSVRVGEYCRFGDTIGRVMHIGLRSTRIRAGDRTIVSIPNADFSQLQLSNLSRRDRIPFETTLGLRYETTAGQLRSVQREVKALISNHPKVDTQHHSLKVFLKDFGESSLDVEVKAYVQTVSWEEFQQVREELLYGILDILEDLNVSLAFPSRTTYLEQADLPVSVSGEA